MAIALFVVSREGSPPLSDEDVAALAQRLRPASLERVPTSCQRSSGVLAAALFPGPYATFARSAGRSALAIGGVGASSGWASIGASIPDHANVVFRADAATAEIVTDIAGSRTVWYVLSDSAILASTSQRLLVACMRSFEFNPQTIPWMLAAGSLGPRLSWDRRVQCLPADATLRLDRTTWRSAITSRPVVWSGGSPSGRTSDAAHVKRLQDTLEEAFRGFPLQDDMVVPVSGGYDSRGILLLLRRCVPSASRLRAITWGTRRAVDEPGNDAHVARELCRSLGVEHEYYVLAPEQLAFAEVFRRFVAVGEGRTDNIGGYVDGFALWKGLADRGVGCVLRGDMGFGYPPAVSERDVRLQTPVPLLDDFDNLREVRCLRDIGMPRPKYIARLPGESCSAWNARLGHEFRLPTTLAALTHLKVSFVEVLNPLLARPLVQCARTLPPRLVAHKRAYKIVVKNLSPPIPFARTPAIPPVGDVCGTAEARAFLRQLLEDRGRAHLPADLVDVLLPALDPVHPMARRPRLRSLLPTAKWAAKTLLPPWLTGLVRSAYARRIPPRNLALRGAIVAQMCDVLAEDARALQATPS